MGFDGLVSLSGGIVVVVCEWVVGFLEDWLFWLRGLGLVGFGSRGWGWVVVEAMSRGSTGFRKIGHAGGLESLLEYRVYVYGLSTRPWTRVSGSTLLLRTW